MCCQIRYKVCFLTIHRSPDKDLDSVSLLLLFFYASWISHLSLPSSGIRSSHYRSIYISSSSCFVFYNMFRWSLITHTLYMFLLFLFSPFILLLTLNTLSSSRISRFLILSTLVQYFIGNDTFE